MNFSVIICCYNSEARLPETLQYMAKQQVPDGVQWELIIVDNNSTDKTQEVATAEWEHAGKPVTMKIVNEPNAGLSYARHKGVQESSFEYIIFCDDDNWFYPDYIALSVDIFKANPRVKIIGGQGLPVYEKEPEKWFTDNKLVQGLATGKLMEKSGIITHKRAYVYGAGMVMDKSLFNTIIQKPFLLEDRKGKNLTSGGDLEICYRAILQGYDIWYEDAMKFYHYIPDGRCSLSYQLRLAYGKGYSAAFLRIYTLVVTNHEYVNRNNVWVRILYRKLKSFIRQNIFKINANPDPNMYEIEKCGLKGYIKGHLSMAFSFGKILEDLKRERK
ncbi:MAG: glycosyltransferase [Bacteroidota bacterium]|nr:glycosyltransferase [Bacteroidota bacterium]